jgi:hypothetical protein
MLQTAFIYKPAKWECVNELNNTLQAWDNLSQCHIEEQPYNVPSERYLLSGLILSIANTRKLHEFHPTAEAAKEALEAHRLELLKSFMAGFTISPL